MPSNVPNTREVVVGHQTLTVSNSAVGLTIPSANVDRAIFVVRDAELRWRVDGTDPTSSVGHPQDAYTEFALDTIGELEAFKAIRTTSTTSELNILYIRDEP